MPFYRVGDLMVHMKLSGRGKAPAACRARIAPRLLVSGGRPLTVCCAMSAFLCDWPVGSQGQTCDAPVCEEHAYQVGTNRHYCPDHFARYREQQPELF